MTAIFLPTEPSLSIWCLIRVSTMQGAYKEKETTRPGAAVKSRVLIIDTKWPALTVATVQIISFHSFNSAIKEKIGSHPTCDKDAHLQWCMTESVNGCGAIGPHLVVRAQKYG
eukprot:TRINITY_DN45380_c1_g1_i1.p1 TRINITY_DN45380_c1_g1~~TRINITY_DN45380_c1_g1_i1.p1  ORF type:complete len:113 (-),score=9.22 TRINITY_DN45380_c1_g1_i1:159-497(-)